MELSNELVPKFYTLNPETEELLANGHKLRDGMVVIVGTSDARVDLDELETAPEWLKARALSKNRWGVVSNVEYDTRRDVTMCVLTYADGTQVKHSYGAPIPWVVKKATIPNEPSKLDLIAWMISEVVTEHDKNASNEQRMVETNDFIQETAKKIVDLF